MLFACCWAACSTEDPGPNAGDHPSSDAATFPLRDGAPSRPEDVATSSPPEPDARAPGLADSGATVPGANDAASTVLRDQASSEPRDASSPVIGPRDAGTDTMSAPPTTFAVQFADSILRRWPDPRTITGVTRGWDYNNGIVLRGMLEVHARTGDPRYLAYIKRYVDGFVDAAGKIYVDAARTSPIEEQPHSLDIIQPAQLLLYLAERYPTDPRYLAAAASVRALFAKFPVNSSGGFWHKATYPNEMWLDGIYMAEPFLARYGAANPSCGAYCADTPIAQITLIATNVRLGSGLFAHGWDADQNALWCTGACAAANGNGRSNEVWGRALGWYAMALTDVLPYLPAGHAGRAALTSLLAGLAEAARLAQDPASGLWCEVVDKCGQPGNWAESSGSGMLVYALKRAIEQRDLDARYIAVAESAWRGLKLAITSDASGPIINDAADGSSILASYEAYVAVPRRSNSYHGLAAIQLAAAAMELAPAP